MSALTLPTTRRLGSRRLGEFHENRTELFRLLANFLVRRLDQQQGSCFVRVTCDEADAPQDIRATMAEVLGAGRRVQKKRLYKRKRGDFVLVATTRKPRSATELEFVSLSKDGKTIVVRDMAAPSASCVERDHQDGLIEIVTGFGDAGLDVTIPEPPPLLSMRISYPHEHGIYRAINSFHQEYTRARDAQIGAFWAKASDIYNSARVTPGTATRQGKAPSTSTGPLLLAAEKLSLLARTEGAKQRVLDGYLALMGDGNPDCGSSKLWEAAFAPCVTISSADPDQLDEVFLDDLATRLTPYIPLTIPDGMEDFLAKHAPSPA